ncbi:MAG: hypothetical protein ACK4J2_07205 [Sulfurihydrogenibium azorense]|uniref:hypothetical protein n=1 Tax=Sulfurihydrogenibium azorense TaxID=309806 RepID=UPI00391BB3BA
MEREITLKLKTLYGKEKATLEELLSSRAGINLLPYEIAVNGSVDWEKFNIPEEIYKKACIIYNNYSYLIKREKPLPKVNEKLSDIEVRKIFEVLRSIE